MARPTFYKYTTRKVGDNVVSVQVKMTSREVKAYVMKQNGWTSSQYQKQYDILKNKVRAYESFRRSQGIKEQPQNVVKMLYTEAKAKARFGEDYKPSEKMQQIKRFSAYSITKGRQLAQQEKYIARETSKYNAYVSERFKGFIEANKGAERIANAITNPVMREKALSDYADKLNVKIAEDQEEQKSGAIPAGETYGSEESIDFDISDYLENSEE